MRERRYDLVLATHCFGTLIPDFNAYRVISSRDLMQFDPAGDLHESEFNAAFLEAAPARPSSSPSSSGATTRSAAS